MARLDKLTDMRDTYAPKLDAETVEKALVHFREMDATLEQQRSRLFIRLCEGFGWHEAAERAKEQGLPRHIISATNVVIGVKMAFIGVVEVSSLGLLEDGKVFMTWDSEKQHIEMQCYETGAARN